MSIQLDSSIQQFTGELWKYHLPIPEEIVKEFIEGRNKRVICEINGVFKWQTAFMKTAEYWFITVNQDIMDTCELKVYQKVHLKISKDTSTYGMEMPEELFELFKQDDQAYTYFQKVSPGKQRNLIYIVNKVKSSDSRLRKALAIAHHLKETKGTINFKLLNETIKQFNQKNP